jgi:adenine-specific DNA-methyltransferase
MLPTPYYEDDRVTLYCGDAAQLLRDLPEDTIPLTVTSPPYNIGKAYESIQPVETYVRWCEEWIANIHKATRTDGALWLNVGYLPVSGRGKAIPIPYLLWNRIPFFIIQEVVWNYGAGVAARYSFSPRNEKLLFCVKDEKRYTFNLDDVRDPDVKYPNQFKNGRRKVNSLGKNPSDVWQIPKVTSGRNRSSRERVDFPAQYPLALVERCIKVSSHPGDLVLDPFMGSGSTAVAALRTGRRVIGFEIDEEYCGLTVERIRAHYDSGDQATLALGDR